MIRSLSFVIQQQRKKTPLILSLSKDERNLSKPALSLSKGG